MLVRGYDGFPERVWLYNTIIEIKELGIFRPERGVLKTIGKVGVIGMDILQHCELHMIANVFVLELVNKKKTTKGIICKLKLLLNR